MAAPNTYYAIQKQDVEFEDITATGTLAATGAITATGGVVGAVTGAVTGNVTGNLTGNVTGNLTGNVTGNVTGTHIGGQQDSVVTISGDGAITVAPSSVYLSKASAAAITIVAPTSVTHDGYLIRVVCQTAQAHVITCASVGFNAKGSSGTITFAAAIGNSVLLEAKGGNWYVIGNIGGTVA